MKNELSFKNKSLKRIVNVYQLNYKNNFATGFGDFLNGCFFLLQICRKFNLIFDIDISNHPISKYFINNKPMQMINYNNILFYNLNENIRSNKFLCYNNFINNLNNIKGENYYLFCNFDPIYNVQESGRNIIKNKLIPTLEIDERISNILSIFNLYINQFEIIHIRTGDKYLLNNKVLTEEDEIKYKEFLLKNTQNSINYIIISDNINLKNTLKKYNNYFILDCEIGHCGENIIHSDETLKNTVVDFFLMSKSKKITSISLKSRGGTGFSRLAAELFNIRYNSLLIDLGHHLY